MPYHHTQTSANIAVTCLPQHTYSAQSKPCLLLLSCAPRKAEMVPAAEHLRECSW